MDLGITAIASAFPARVVSSEAVAVLNGFDPSFITEKLGIDQHFELEQGESVSGLAAKAVGAVLDKTKTDPSQVGLLIVVTQTPDYCLPHVSAIVQAAVGIAKEAVVLDVNLGCSGFVIGLATAVSLMEAQKIDVGVLVTVDAYSRIVDPCDRSTAPLFGDGAAATLISKDWLYRPGAYTFGSDGSMHESLIAHGTGSTSEPRRPLFMDGRTIYNFAMSEVPRDVLRCLDLNNEVLETIDSFVFHQANAFMVESIRSHLGIPRQRTILSISDVGNTTSSSIPIALERKVLANAPSPRKVFICGFGVGLSWASTVLYAS